MFIVKDELTGKEQAFSEYWDAIQFAGRTASNYFKRHVIAEFINDNTIVIRRQKRR